VRRVVGVPRCEEGDAALVRRGTGAAECSSTVPAACPHARTLAPERASPARAAPTGITALSSTCGVPASALSYSDDAGPAPPSCSLCPQLGACTSVLDSLVTAALTPGGALIAACGDSVDVLTLTLLRDQSQATCNAAAVAEYGSRASGYMSMAALTQCTSCGVMPCAPGMFCPGGEAPPPCPEGERWRTRSRSRTARRVSS
jgi:hypothetical protein